MTHLHLSSVGRTGAPTAVHPASRRRAVRSGWRHALARAGAALTLFVAVAFAAPLPGCAVAAAAEASVDGELLWLEDSASPRTRAWVETNTRRTTQQLQSDPRYRSIRAGLFESLSSPQRIPTGKYFPGALYHVRVDGSHPAGALRRTPIDSLGAIEASEIALDFGSVEVGGQRGWGYGGYRNFLEQLDCLPPGFTRCLVPLSQGGRDAIVVQERDLATGSLPPNAFATSREALTHFAWLDSDNVVILTSVAPSERLKSGTGRYVRRWGRGKTLASAPIVYDCGESALRCDLTTYRSEGKLYAFAVSIPAGRTDSTRRAVYFDVDGHDVREIPQLASYSSELLGVSRGRAIVRLGEGMEIDGRRIPAGSVVALDLRRGSDASAAPEVEVVILGSRLQVVNALYSTAVTDTAVWLVVMRDVSSHLLKAERVGNAWLTTPVDLPSDGTISIHGAVLDSVFVQYEGFLNPPELWRISESNTAVRLRALPPQFDASGLTVRQHFVRSADGTRVPYFVIAPRDRGVRSVPTLLTGYGGFGISQPPLYLNYTIARWLIQKPWLEHGGAIVVANTRGGGEYGPEWHSAAIGTGRHRAFEDFIAVAEDVIRSGLATREQLGIFGTSNGGLLVGAALNMRPDLFGAATIGVPLLDMKRYADLMAGSTWIPEYGDPRTDAKVAAFWDQYSPFQNLSRERTYPPILVWGSGTDDRVHPGHGRRYVERLNALGKSAEYFEVASGGHFGSGGPDELATLVAMHTVYFLQKLAVTPPTGDADTRSH